MSVLVVGVSHRTAPVSVLEQLALDPDGVAKLIHQVVECEHVLEATVLSTCNRIEIYAEVDRFHGSVESVSRVLCERAVERPEEIVPHLYVHYDDGAVAHLFNVASGLDSMVVGEGQILGQAREALRLGQESGTIGPALNVLFQQALRVGKRAHSETENANRPPARSTRATSVTTVVASATNCSAPNAENAMSNDSSANGSVVAFAHTVATATPVSASIRAACCSWRCERSSPTGRAPWVTSHRAHCAAPQPISSTSRPATSPRMCTEASSTPSGDQMKPTSLRKSPCSAW